MEELLRTPNATHALLSGRIRNVDEAREVGKWLETADRLIHLDVSFNYLGPDSIMCMLHGLARKNTVVSAYLWGNNFGDEGAKILGEWIGNNTSVQNLDVDGNNIGTAGARCIGEGLGNNTTIRQLRLYSNNIGDDGVGHICDGIDKSNTIQTLNISSINMGGDGMRRVADTLKRNTSIKHIKLDFNVVTAAAVVYLRNALTFNTTVQQITMDSIDDGIDSLIVRNKAIHEQNVTTFNMFQSLMINGEIAKLPKHLMVVIKDNLLD